MVKKQNCVAGSYKAPDCLIFYIQAEDILCTSPNGGTEDGSILSGNSWEE